MKKFIKTDEKIEVSNYPYGRLRCTLFDSMEFNDKKGYRHVTQTINPKTGRHNNPKKSTYFVIMVRWYDEETNHIKAGSFSLNGDEELNRASKFIYENFDLFTTEEIEYIAKQFLLWSKVSLQGSITYGGAKLDDLKPLYSELISSMAKQWKNPTENHFGALLDIEAIKNCKDPNYNPFRTTKAVNIMDL